MLEVVETAQFKRMRRKAVKQGRDMQKLKTAVRLLATQQPLPPTYKDHALQHNLKGLRDCHIQPDWLLIYRTTPTSLQLVALGSHSELFKK